MTTSASLIVAGSVVALILFPGTAFSSSTFCWSRRYLNRPEMPGKSFSQRQSDIPEADNADCFIEKVLWNHGTKHLLVKCCFYHSMGQGKNISGTVLFNSKDRQGVVPGRDGLPCHILPGQQGMTLVCTGEHKNPPATGIETGTMHR